MPRYARLRAPQTLHHLISRFVQRSYFLATDDERHAYLSRVPAVLDKTDWRPMAYALMNSHVHWAAWSGNDPSWRFVQPLHLGFAQWMNRRMRSIGPIFADRHKAIICPAERAAILLAYIHNNPVHARLVDDPADCSWTSHRAYLGLAPAPAWLRVEQGLSLCGFDSSPAGRLAFHQFVLQQAAQAVDPQLSGGDLRAQRRRIRQSLGAPVEISSAIVQLDAAQQAHVVLAPREMVLRPRWEGEPQTVIERVAQELGLSTAALSSRDRSRSVVQARRLALWVWTRQLGRAQGEMGAALGLSSSAVSHLLRSAQGPILEQKANLVARACRSGGADRN